MSAPYDWATDDSGLADDGGEPAYWPAPGEPRCASCGFPVAWDVAQGFCPVAGPFLSVGVGQEQAVVDAQGRTPEECWRAGEVFKLVGARVSGR